MTLEIQVLSWDGHKHMAGLNPLLTVHFPGLIEAPKLKQNLDF
jgi:hypothetical protein